jgi:hypothetical protein
MSRSTSFAIEAVYGPIARAGRFERESAPNLLGDIFRLIVAEMMPAPEAESLLSDEVERFRFCALTTRFLLWRVFWSGHRHLKRLAELRHQQEDAGKTFLAGVEKLVDQAFAVSLLQLLDQGLHVGRDCFFRGLLLLRLV